MAKTSLAVLALSFGLGTTATYLQSAACSGYSLNSWTAGANYTIHDAKLDHAGQTSELSLILGKYLTEEECAVLPANATLLLSTRHAGESTEHRFDLEPHCNETRPRYHQVRLPITADVGPVSAFSTMAMRLELNMEGLGEVACVEAKITSAPHKATAMLLRWIPVGICVLILLASAIRTLCLERRSAANTVGLTMEILPDASVCLYYLQFAFLSSSLTLSYPGFFQPIMSHLNVLALFNPGPLAYSHAYSSTQDGIYVVNGTYGGTLGFETMHQLVGVPQTMDTWYNMIIAVLIIATVLAAILQIIHCTRLDTKVGAETFAERFRTVLKVVLFYFALPLCALTFYQVNYAMILPTYHTVFASLAIILVLVAFVWLFGNFPLSKSGLMATGRLKIRNVDSGLGQDSMRQESLLLATQASLTFIRGAVIGALQHFPVVQLSLLIACELGLAFAILRLRTGKQNTVKAISAMIRTITLAMLCCFLPGLTKGTSKSVLGYTILALHACALIFLFFLPAVYRLILILWKGPKETTPPVYGLRRLNRRELGITHVLTDTKVLSSDAKPLSLAERGNSPDESSSSKTTRTLDLLQRQSGFFRQPSRSSMFPVYSTDEYSRPSSTSHHQAAPEEKPGPSLPLESPTIGESSSSSSSLEIGKNTFAESSQSLGPRWDDFTFREADLIYGTPFRTREAGQSPHVNRPAGVLERLRASAVLQVFDWRRYGFLSPESVPQSGFHVVRPTHVASEISLEGEDS